MTDYERPASCPKPGEVEAFDAGWNAHRAGISLKTVEVLSGGMASVAWKAREYMAGEPKPEDQLTIDDEIERKDGDGDRCQRGGGAGTEEEGPQDRDAPDPA